MRNAKNERIKRGERMKRDIEKVCLIFIISVFLLVIMIQACMTAQLTSNYQQVKEEYRIVSEKVKEHEKIMRAYEFYNWHYSLQMLGEEGNESDN